MYEITVAVCVYKQKHWLHRCLRSLTSQTLEKSRYEVVVVNDEVISDGGASSMSDMGKVMPEVMKRSEGKADGKMTQTIVSNILH